MEAAYGEEFLLSARVGGGGFGVMLTGIGGKVNIGIVVQAEEIVVKTYNAWGEHIWENIGVPLLR